jgi:hypothetical protein
MPHAHPQTTVPYLNMGCLLKCACCRGNAGNFNGGGVVNRRLHANSLPGAPVTASTTRGTLDMIGTSPWQG